MTTSQKVDAYIEKQDKWQKELREIRAVFNTTKLTENLKWGVPVYTFNGKNIVGMVGFKNHLGIWFYQGVFLKDPNKILVVTEKNAAKAQRQWRINDGETIDYKLLKGYILEAIENQKAGKELKPTKKKIVNAPFLKQFLKENLSVATAFEKLTPGKQNEYMEFILSAKQEATKLRRLEKIKPQILQGKGLYDKYKNC